MTNFTEMARAVANRIFMCETPQGKIEIQEHVQEKITTAIGNAIKHMRKYHPTRTLDLGPFRYGVDSFDLVNPIDFWNSTSQYKEEPGVEIIEKIASQIQNKKFIKLVGHYCRMDTYVELIDEWTRAEDTTNSVEMDKQSIQLLIAVHVITIATILLRSADFNKPNEEGASCELLEGTYTLKHDMYHWAFGFTAAQ